MEIVIKEVITKSELRTFVEFPNKLFRKCKNYIPSLISDDLSTLSKKNPAHEYCDSKLWMAYIGGRVVGRVAAIINRKANERWNEKKVRFGWFDFVEDINVCSKLLEKVEEFGRENGMTEIHGPMSFTDMDKECWITKGFDERQNMTLLYNLPYYVEFIERLGYGITCEWAQNKMPASQPVPEKVARINSLIMEKYNLRLLKFKSCKEIIPYAKSFFEALNEAFNSGGIYSFVPLSVKEIDIYIKSYFSVLDPKLVSLVVDENDQVVAFGLSIPDLNEGFRKANGHLFPFGWFHILKCLYKYDTIDLLLNGVRPEWQKRGVHSIYYSDMNEVAIKHGIKTAYTNPQIIGNEAVKIWSNNYESEEVIRRAVFGKPLDC
jgi:hypothetical protein